VGEEIGLEPDIVAEQMNGLVWLNSEEQLSPEFMGTPDNIGALAQTLKDTGDFMMEQGTISSSPELSAYREKVNLELWQQIA
jgi:taurine transport system substrate-binding protein